MAYQVLEKRWFGDMLLVIYDPNGPVRNLYAYDRAGGRRWIAENRQPRDPFTSFVGDGTLLQVATWDCFCCTLNPENGEIVTAEFTK